MDIIADMNRQISLDVAVINLFARGNQIKQSQTNQISGIWETFHGEIYHVEPQTKNITENIKEEV